MDRVDMPKPVVDPATATADIPGPRRFFPMGMSRRRIIRRRGVVTTMRACIILATLAAMNSQTFALSQHATPAAATSGNELSEAQALAAFAAARAWLNDFAAPRMSDAASSVALDHASAVCVILRRNGRLMGVGVDDLGDALMLRRAVGRAMNDTLADPALQSLANAIRQDAREGEGDQRASAAAAESQLDALRAELGRTLTLELEIAGPRTPLVGATMDALAAKIEPGLEGVSLRRNQKWAHAFPAQLRLTNLGGESEKSLTSLAVNAGISMADLRNLGAVNDASFYVFPTIDLAQSAPDSTPVRLFRGKTLIAQTDVTRERVAALADGLTRHLLQSRWPEPPVGQTRLPLGFMGDYNAATDQYSPTAAAPLEQALCAMALTRYAQSPAADAALAKEAALAGRQALRDLADAAPGEVVATDDLAACAAMLMVACDMPSCLGDSGIQTMMQSARKRLESSFDPDRGFLAQHGEVSADGQVLSRSINPMTRAMIVSAWARMLGAKVGELPAPNAETIRAALDAAWDSTAEPQRVALLPWIGWAEIEFARSQGVDLAHIEEMQRLAAALDRVRLVDDKAITGAPDLMGGLALTSESNDQPRPTAQTLRPAAWLATIVFDGRLTPADRQSAAWAAHLQTMRFACQLAVSELQAATTRNPTRAIGGICASVWDSRQPVAAQSLGLLTAVETIRNWPKTP